MITKFGYGLKALIESAISSGQLDAGDIIITSDTKEIAFVKSDKSVVYSKSRDEIFETLENAQAYLSNAAAYVGETIKAKLEDGKYHTYVLQPSDSGYVLEELCIASDIKQYVVIGTRPESGQQEGIIYIENNIGYIWNGSEWIKVFEDFSADLDEKAPINNPNLTGTVNINGKEVATQEYVANAIAENSNGTPGIVDQTDSPLPTTSYKAGQTWRVAEAGTYAGSVCEPGDLIICLTDYVAESASNSDFMIVQANIDGAVTSNAVSTTDSNLVIFDGTTGKIIKDSQISLTTLNDTISKAHTHDNKTVLDSYTKTETELLSTASTDAQNKIDTFAETVYTKTEIDTRVGGIPSETSIKSYIDTAIGSGGTDAAEAIAQAKQEAIETSKAYTDSSLTVVEF